jgi:hypothetical protein
MQLSFSVKNVLLFPSIFRKLAKQTHCTLKVFVVQRRTCKKLKNVFIDLLQVGQTDVHSRQFNCPVRIPLVEPDDDVERRKLGRDVARRIVATHRQRLQLRGRAQPV